MRRTVPSLLLLFGLALAGAGSLAQEKPAPEKPAPTAAAPRIAVEPAGFDFGDALQNKSLQKQFTIKNFGGSELQIEGVSTTCGCTVAALDTKTLAPGASVPMRVTMETRSYSGAIERTVLIRSNDPEKGRLEVKLKANVQAAPAK